MYIRAVIFCLQIVDVRSDELLYVNNENHFRFA